MIWGKTYIQKISPQWVFCWLPTVLDDGRWIWLQKAWRKYPDPSPHRYDPFPRYYETPPELIPQEPISNERP